MNVRKANRSPNPGPRPLRRLLFAAAPVSHARCNDATSAVQVPIRYAAGWPSAQDLNFSKLSDSPLSTASPLSQLSTVLLALEAWQKSLRPVM